MPKSLFCYKSNECLIQPDVRTVSKNVRNERSQANVRRDESERATIKEHIKEPLTVIATNQKPLLTKLY